MQILPEPARRLVLSTVNEDSLLERLEGLVIGFTSRRAEDQLGLQAPVLRHVPSGCDLLVDQRVVVLKVGTKSF